MCLPEFPQAIGRRLVNRHWVITAAVGLGIGRDRYLGTGIGRETITARCYRNGGQRRVGGYRIHRRRINAYTAVVILIVCYEIVDISCTVRISRP